MNKTERNRLKRARRKEFVDNYKVAYGCLECQTKENLTFHHIRPKSFSISGVFSKTLTTLKREIDKCVVLCRDCHDRVHGMTKAGKQYDED